MTGGSLGSVLQRLGNSILRSDGADLPDGELLERFVARRDEAAFEALLHRHGPMVLGVCRHVLENVADAEDAFQATFLILVRKAASVRPRSMVGNWLYGVARTTALKARAMNTRRRAKEKEAGSQSRPEAAGVSPEAEALDQELQGLPDKYRAPIVLCDLEGHSMREAARLVGCPEGTLSSRLTRGRVLLGRRLLRRGLTLSAALLSGPAASAELPAGLAAATLKAAGLSAAGATAGAAASTNVLTLTHEVLKTMLLTKIKVGALLLLAGVAIAGAGTVVLTTTGAMAAGDGPSAAQPADPPGSGVGPKTPADARANKPEGRDDADRLVAPKLVRLVFKDTPLPEAVAEFQKQSGYELSLSDPEGKLKDRRITLDTGEVTFWHALGLFCRAANLIESQGPSGAPGAAPPAAGSGTGAPGAAPPAAGSGTGTPGTGGGAPGAGPITFFAANPGARGILLADGKPPSLPTDDRSAVRVRALPRATGIAPDGDVLLVLEVVAEPKVSLMAYGTIKITKATDDQGQNLEPAASGAPEAGVGLRPVRLKPGAKPSKSLAEVRGTITLRLVVDARDGVAVEVPFRLQGVPLQ
jgi:RNA polymerase sigma factor (sigma-70 family)